MNLKNYNNNDGAGANNPTLGTNTPPEETLLEETLLEETPPEETPQSEIQVKKRREHPLGKMVKIKVYALSPTDKKGQVHAAINQFSYDLQQNTIVSVPEAIAKFLSNATKIKHTVNEKGFGANVNEPLYAVTYV